MARFRRQSMALRPVHRIKHVIDASSTLAGAAQLNQTILTTVDAPVISSRTQCETGSKVYGIYLKVIVASNEAQDVGAIPNVYMTVWKNPAGTLTLPAPNAVGLSTLKKYAIHQEMVMIDNKLGGQPTVLFNGVVKIPKGYVRNGPADTIEVSVLSPALNIVVCFQAHYKEFR